MWSCRAAACTDPVCATVTNVRISFSFTESLLWLLFRDGIIFSGTETIATADSSRLQIDARNASTEYQATAIAAVCPNVMIDGNVDAGAMARWW
ncbi:hypothetical protein AC630_35205 [Bradyrhizobium sp. AS23.2]|nr:hypothetical protein AC630_35205 [Bradyrhizobium sp. AS23.2]